jgi:ABC-type maltose transport system permease subunit
MFPGVLALTAIYALMTQIQKVFAAFGINTLGALAWSTSAGRSA